MRPYEIHIKSYEIIRKIYKIHIQAYENHRKSYWTPYHIQNWPSPLPQKQFCRNLKEREARRRQHGGILAESGEHLKRRQARGQEAARAHQEPKNNKCTSKGSVSLRSGAHFKTTAKMSCQQKRKRNSHRDESATTEEAILQVGNRFARVK